MCRIRKICGAIWLMMIVLLVGLGAVVAEDAPPAGQGVEPFFFKDSLRFGMSREEVRQVFVDAGLTMYADDPSSGVMMYQDASFWGYQATCSPFFDDDDRLSSLRLSIHKDNNFFVFTTLEDCIEVINQELAKQFAVSPIEMKDEFSDLWLYRMPGTGCEVSLQPWAVHVTFYPAEPVDPAKLARICEGGTFFGTFAFGDSKETVAERVAASALDWPEAEKSNNSDLWIYRQMTIADKAARSVSLLFDRHGFLNEVRVRYSFEGDADGYWTYRETCAAMQQIYGEPIAVESPPFAETIFEQVGVEIVVGQNSVYDLRVTFAAK